MLLVLLNSTTLFAQSLVHYHHNTFWARVAVSDKITNKLSWELFWQHRSQNDAKDKANIFKHYQLSSYWSLLHYQVSPNVRVSLTPFCYFYTKPLIPAPADQGNRGIKEFRWALQLEHTQHYKIFSFANRYSVEYRLRDLRRENLYDYNFRIRYRARLEKFLNKTGRPFSVILYDEILFEFGPALRDSPAIFNQNRLYGGFRYEMVKNVRFTLGYMYVVQERRSGKAIDEANTIWAVLTFDNIFSQFAARPKKV